MSLTVSAEVKRHQETCARMETEHKNQEERLRTMQAVSIISFLSVDLTERHSTFAVAGGCTKIRARCGANRWLVPMVLIGLHVHLYYLFPFFLCLFYEKYALSKTFIVTGFLITSTCTDFHQ